MLVAGLIIVLPGLLSCCCLSIRCSWKNRSCVPIGNTILFPFLELKLRLRWVAVAVSSSFGALLVDDDGFEVVAGVGGDGWGGDGTGSCGVELFGDVVGEEIGVNAEDGDFVGVSVFA